ncbi:DUF6950 family protein [Methylobacterium nodulans]|uniref:DUF6950 domain-containing protein n=1 Tax=Methylobacterium nodulans (strain LMG 21967 / CNCM I-2342 / ORS 2060) TaxID=460265 RepID=B8IQM0_METNO|nr:hypothetical protein [Methylobacterium nodulans]ACL60532.1 conserved hypothetical protein [Methylobacterium nodulans ORS 2060]
MRSPPPDTAVLLVDHLRAGSRTPFAWGTCDCALWAADWVKARCGIDPAGGLRGRYRTAIGAGRHIRRLGGFVAQVRGLMASAGFAETREPAIGDVAVVDTPVGPALAIRTRTGWAAKAERGVICAPFPVLAAWSLA